MPFKDNANTLSPGSTFQGPRAAALGASLLDALAHVAPSLRGVSHPVFGAEDAYVAPIEEAQQVAAFVREQRAALAAELVAATAATDSVDAPPSKKHRS